MSLKYLLLCFAMAGFGMLAAGGVFTVFVSVGLVPRFADKTHTGKYLTLYENSIVAGAVSGCIFSVYADFFIRLAGESRVARWPGWQLWGRVILLVFGLFAGIFVGCIAIAIAEMLNTIPIFVRRIRLGRGLGITLLAVALGKTVGALLYFYFRCGPE
jgi:stage V sporulation protein AB